MSASDFRDVLATFSPGSDFFAIVSSDGRIKIWETVKGQLQTEFSKIGSSDPSSMLHQQEKGHLSLDYTCMEWVEIEAKKKKKKRHGCSLLVLGTGNGDVLALDVTVAQLRWKISDCHPGGVSAICCSGFGIMYSAGVDGNVCKIDTLSGSVNTRFKASTKAISSLSISADGRMLATASSQLKVFSCSDYKKIQKFSGHSAAVRCMIFSEDGSYVISSGVGERYVAIWRIDGAKKQHAICVLSMEHPAIYIDSKGSHASETTGLHVLAISEIDLCYIWHGSTIEELRTSKPTKISFPVEVSGFRNRNCSIFAAKFQDSMTVDSGQVLLAYGALVKPLFEKRQVLYGTDMTLNKAQDGVLMPVGQFPQKGQAPQTKVSALDRSNAEDASLPIAKVYVPSKKRKHVPPNSLPGTEGPMSNSDATGNNKIGISDMSVDFLRIKEDGVTCLEDKLKALGILGIKYYDGTEFHDRALSDVFSLISISTPAKKIKAHVLSMSPSAACEFLEVLVSEWKRRPTSSNNIIPWIYSVLINQGHYIINQDSSSQIIHDLQQMTMSKDAVIRPLSMLCGRLHLIRTQINKADQGSGLAPHDRQPSDESEVEDEDEDIDELVYGEEDDESQSDQGDGNVHQP